jgi:glycerophosphoryl diester phosphodiesterase
MRHPYFAVPTPIVIGHRGCAGEAPENTLLAFERGLGAGAAILESDVHLTRDVVPVLMHDAEVDRVTEGTGPVCEFTLAELRHLDAGHRFSPDGGETHPFRGQGLRIPTFEEALKAFPGARFNLELKANRPGIVEATVGAVVRNGRESLTLVTTGDDDLMARLRSHIASRNVPVAQGASVADILDVVRTAGDGSAPTTPSMALQIPAEFGGRRLVTRELVDHAHAHDIQVHVWTINTAEEMAELLDLGVDGIVTDFPGRLTELIGRRRAAFEG